MKTCSKCKQSKSESNFGRHKSTSDGLQSWCKLCKRRAMRQYRGGTEYIVKYGDIALEIKELISKAKLDSGCVVCGEKEPCTLDFHHVYGKKLFTVSSYRVQRRSIAEVKDEIAKCVILCSNCHRKFHRGIINI